VPDIAHESVWGAHPLAEQQRCCRRAAALCDSIGELRRRRALQFNKQRLRAISLVCELFQAVENCAGAA
jgi:hypothetical protein